VLALEPVHGSCVVRLREERVHALDDLEHDVLAGVREHGPVSGNAVAKLIGRRRDDVLGTLRTCAAAGKVIRTRNGWEVVPNAPEPPRNHMPGASGGGGSPGGDTPVGGPPWEPPQAAPVPNGGTALDEEQLVIALREAFDATEEQA
jgi:hypothetical protein